MLKIIFIDKDISKKALKDFWNHFQNHKSLESNIGRYLLFTYTKSIPKTDPNGVPLFEKDIFWSLSHKQNLVFIGWDSTEIWVDIEILKSRWEEIFTLHSENEYTMIWQKNIQNFYSLWTIKESIIKLFLSSIDCLEDIHIHTLTPLSQTIDTIKFQYHFSWEFQNQRFEWWTGQDGEIIYSFAKKFDFERKKYII